MPRANGGQAARTPLQHQGPVRAAAFSPDGNSVVTASADKTARLWPAFRPLPGDPERILVWSEVRTGLTVDEYGEVRTLSAAAWHDRRARLEKPGGAPLPD